MCGPRESFATGQRLEVTGCEDNASGRNAEAHTDEHLELAVWDTTFLNSIFRMMPDLNPVRLAKACNTFSSRHLASTKTCPHAKGCTERAPGMPKVALHIGQHDRNESTRISTFSTSTQNQGIQTAHWKRFKIIRVKHTSDGNIAVSHSHMFETLLKLELCLCIRHKRSTETLFRRVVLVHFAASAHLKHCSKLELCLCIRHK